jgi:hypothetical protein
MAKLDDSPASLVSAFDLENLVGEQLALPLSDHNAMTIMLTNGEGPQFVRNTIRAAELAAASPRSRSSHARPELSPGIAAKIILEGDLDNSPQSRCRQQF